MFLHRNTRWKWLKIKQMAVAKPLKIFLQKNRRLAAAALAATHAVNVLTVLLPLSIGLFYEIVLADGGSAKGRIWAFLPGKVETVAGFFWFFGGLVLGRAVFVFLDKYWSAQLGEGFAGELRERLFSGYLRQNLTEFEQKSIGKRVSKFSGELTAAQNLLTKGVLDVVGDACLLAFAFAALFALQPLLAGAAAAVLATGAAVVLFLGKFVEAAAQRRRDRRGQLLDFVAQRLHAFQTVKSLNREGPEARQFEKLNRRFARRSRGFARWTAAVQGLVPLFFFGSMGVVMAVVAFSGRHFPHGDVFVFMLLMLYLQGPVRRLLGAGAVWRAGRSSLRKLSEVIDFEEIKASTGLAFEKNSASPNLRVEGLDFDFETGKPLFQNLSFEAKFGQITQLAGRPGSGQSTLLEVLQKLREPSAGAIWLGGVAFGELSSFEVRKKVAIVSAKVPLLGETVFDAVAYSDTPERRARAARWLEKLEIRLAETPEAALNLPLRGISPGEQMLLQFVRAVLSGKPIWLLDEPFRWLDSERTALIVRQLEKLKLEKTILLAAEHLPAGLRADWVVDLQNQQ